jgi:AcrR family transcriptional regulator
LNAILTTFKKEARLADYHLRVGSGSVYKAFKDKKEIFLAAFDHLAEERSAKLRRILGAVRSGIDAPARLMLCVLHGMRVVGKTGAAARKWPRWGMPQ